MDIELELVSGTPIKLTLPEAGDFESFYVFSMEYSGNIQFWKLLLRLMAAAGRPVYDIHEALREQGLEVGQVKPSALRQLLNLHGYGFGTIFDFNSEPQNPPLRDRHKLLFLRDPRSVLVAWYHNYMRQPGTTPGHGRHRLDGETMEPAPASFTEFLQSPAVEGVASRYRRFAELYRQGRNVSLLRYEHAAAGWHQIAADIVAPLKLPIEPLVAASIAADDTPIGDSLPEHDRPPYPRVPNAASVLSRNEIAEMEMRLGDVLADFGYVPCEASIDRPPVAPKKRPGADAAPAPIRGDLNERDPVLLTRLKPNGSAEMQVLGRRLIMDVDATGHRPVIGQPAKGEKTLAVFGCSFTYGIAIAADETFCSLLQGMFPAWRVENHGVSAYSQSRNLIQLERETRSNKPDLVTFCWIENHLFRNVADLSFVQLTSQNMAWPEKQRLPRAMLDSNGGLHMGSVRVPRKDLIGIDLSDFVVDPHYVDQVCFRLFERANSIVTGYGGHFFITTLQGQFSGPLARRLADAGIPVVDASLSGEEYRCWPDDPHPNALANRFYAERIRDYVQRYTAEQPPSKESRTRAATRESANPPAAENSRRHRESPRRLV